MGSSSSAPQAPKPVAPIAALEAPTIDGPVINASQSILQRQLTQEALVGRQQLVIPLKGAGTGVSIPTAPSTNPINPRRYTARPAAPLAQSLSIPFLPNYYSSEGGNGMEATTGGQSGANGGGGGGMGGTP